MLLCNFLSSVQSTMKIPTRMILLLLLTLSTCLSLNIPCLHVRAATTQEFLKGFSATPDSSISSFQPLLTDPTSDFSLGFLRVERSKLALAILHIPSSEPVWLANTTTSVPWSKPTKLFFNGSLILSDSHTGVFWSTGTDGDRLLLLNNSNLQIQKQGNPHSVLWQSFDFPSDTLFENQNFTTSMSLVSSNGIFSMRLADNYLGLFSKVNLDSNQIYWKHTAMEAKAEIVEGQGPIYAQISSNGFLGMYQNLKAPVDVLPFHSFHRPVPGIRRLKLESDGNLRGYYWDGSSWVSDFESISDQCELPSSCGSYGLCRSRNGGCSCLDDRTQYRSGVCFPPKSGDFCSKSEVIRKGFWVLRRKGVELPYKELMEFEQMESLEECESSCERNCSCWGAVFNNATGYCYKVDYPINTLVGVGDESKLGFFKVKNEKKKRVVSFALGVGLVVGAILVFVGVGGFVIYSVWRRSRSRNDRLMEDGLSPGPYKDLDSASFRSLELCKY